MEEFFNNKKRNYHMKKFVPALLVSSLGLLAANPAHAGLSAVGLIDPINHFPSSITDTNNISLEICKDGDPLLGICTFDPVTGGNAWSATTGFGAEVFYNRAQARLTMPNGRRATFAGAVEAAYLNGTPADGQQFVFGRVRYRIDVPGPGRYLVYHPWLAFPGCQPEPYDVAVGGTRVINNTVDIGGGAPFLGVLGADNNANPFLKWDPAVAPLAPAGYLGDAQVPHTITGSQCGINVFRVDGPNIGGAGVNTFSTNLFNITGKIATLQAAPLVIDRATYKRDAAGVSLSVFAQSAPTSTVTLNAQAGVVPATVLATNLGGNFFTRVAAAAVPATVTLNATSPVVGAPSTVKTLPVTDEVDVTPAVWTAPGTLAVTATSSVNVAPFPALTATVGRTPFPMTRNAAGVYTVTVGSLPAPPVSVTVSSSLGGTDEEKIAE
jgi:hypothetical protein